MAAGQLINWQVASVRWQVAGGKFIATRHLPPAIRQASDIKTVSFFGDIIGKSRLSYKDEVKMMMAQVQLSEWETQAIRALGEKQGKSQEEILHDAIAQFLRQHQEYAQVEPPSKFSKLRGITTVDISTDEVMDLTRER